MYSDKSLIETVRSRGHHLTRQRRLIFELLEKSEEHLDADALYFRAKALDPKISLATVYRSLALLKEAGLVMEHRLGESHGHFERIQEAPHFHFTCQKCGLIVELPATQVVDRARKLCEANRLQVMEVSLHFRGICPNCQDKTNG